MKKKKLLFILHSSATTGGAEDNIVSILKFLSRKPDKYVIHAMFPKGERCMEYAAYCEKWAFLQWGFFPVIYVGFSHYIKYFLKFFIQFYQIAGFVWKNNYDLCIVNVSVLLWPVIILKFFNLKVMVMIKETIEPKLFRKNIYRLLSVFADYFIPNSRVIENEFIDVTKKKNITTIYSSVEDEYESSNISNIDLENAIGNYLFRHLTNQRIFKLLCVGNIKKIKNQYLIVKALDLLEKKNKSNNIELFLIGDINEEKSYFDILNKFVLDHGLSNKVHFLGSLNKSYMIKIYQYIDSLIISSLSEGVPLVLVYSLKFKKIVISTNTGGIPDVIKDGYNGFLISNSQKELSEKIEMLQNQQNEFVSITENGYKTYNEKFSWGNNMHQLETIICELTI